MVFARPQARVTISELRWTRTTSLSPTPCKAQPLIVVDHKSILVRQKPSSSQSNWSRSRFNTCACSRSSDALNANDGAAGNSNIPQRRRQSSWERTSSQLVDSATLPFVFLLLPQVIKNSLNLLGGNPEALVALSWVGFTTALAGNTMLLSYFVGKAEQSAALIQALGVGSNFVLLAQIRIAGFMPAAAFTAAAAAVACATVVNVAKLAGWLDSSAAGHNVWSLWSELLGLGGLVLLPQALWNTFTASSSTLPASAAAGVASALFLAKRLGRSPQLLQGLSSNLLGWMATLLFMFQPVAQLVRNFAVPSSLAGVSYGTVMLATLGNALMVPRALITDDLIWFLGSTWGSLLGWAQLLSLYLARTATGEMYISHPTFCRITAIVLVYFGWVLRRDAQHKGVGSALGSLRRIVVGSAGGG